jgi:hypothetical protein
VEYRQFAVPSDAEILDTLGVSPEAAEDDPTVRSFRLASATGGDIVISYDAPGRSFRVQVLSCGAVCLDLLRESATRLSVAVEDGTACVRVTVQAADLTGELEVLVGTDVVVRDRMLMT